MVERFTHLPHTTLTDMALCIEEIVSGSIQDFNADKSAEEVIGSPIVSEQIVAKYFDPRDTTDRGILRVPYDILLPRYCLVSECLDRQYGTARSLSLLAMDGEVLIAGPEGSFKPIEPDKNPASLIVARSFLRSVRSARQFYPTNKTPH